MPLRLGVFWLVQIRKLTALAAYIKEAQPSHSNTPRTTISYCSRAPFFPINSFFLFFRGDSFAQVLVRRESSLLVLSLSLQSLYPGRLSLTCSSIRGRAIKSFKETVQQSSTVSFRLLRFVFPVLRFDRFLFVSCYFRLISFHANCLVFPSILI